MTRWTDEQTGDMLDHTVDLAQAVRTQLPAARALVAQARRDGYPTSSRYDHGSRASIVDELGVPMPPLSDPVGELVVAEDEHHDRDPTRRHVNRAESLCVEARDLLRRAVSELAQTLPPAEKPPDPSEWCWHHLETTGRCEPIHRRGLCWWCELFEREERTLPPAELLDMRQDGKRVLQRDIDRVLRRHTMPKRTRARAKRKAA